MVDTISPLQSVKAYKAAVEAPDYEAQSKAETSLLSTKAEAQKMALDSAKQESTYSQMSKAALARTQQMHTELDVSDNQQRLQLFDLAINESRNNPEVQQRLFKQKDAALEDQVNLQKKVLESKVKQREEDAAVLSSALVSGDATELEQYARETGNNALVGFSKQIRGEAPIPMFRDAQNPQGRTINQLTQDELLRYQSFVLRGANPGRETTSHNIIQEMYAMEKMREASRLKEEELANKSKDAAAKRDGKEKEKKDKDELARKKAFQAATDKYNKDITPVKEAIADLENDLYLTADEKAQLATLKEKQANLEATYKQAERLYQETGIKTTQGTGTKDDPIKL